jgi:cation:H+ antiporter
MNTYVLSFTILLLCLGLMILLIALLVRFGVKLAQFFGASNFTISFVLIAFATSLPEIILGFSSAVKGQSLLGIGIALGSNIVNLTLITGLITVFTRSLNTKNAFRQKQGFLLALLSGLSILLLLDENLSRIDGLILILGYFVYLFELWNARSKESTKKVVIHYTALLYIASVIIFAILSLVFVVEILLETTIFISTDLGVAPVLLGILMISTATAVPELIYEFQALKRQGERLALGDLMGAVGTNITLVLGLIALINPITFTLAPFITPLLFFAALAILFFLIFVYTKEYLHVWEGLILIFIYLIFIVFLFISAL